MGTGGVIGRARRALAATALPAGVTGLCLLVLLGAGCSPETERARGLDSALAALAGVSDAEVDPATRDRLERIRVVLDRGLDATQTLEVAREVADEARAAGSRQYVLELRRSLVEEDVLVVDEEFAGDRRAGSVVGAWLRLVDALFGEVTYSYGGGREDVTVVSGAGVGHDVEETSRIGHGQPTTTWRFAGDDAELVVSGRVRPRDVLLFDRVQRTVGSSTLPVPAAAWTLHRRTAQVTLALDVALPGAGPERITLRRWADDLRPLAAGAVAASRYAGLPRWIQLTDVSAGDRDTFAAWSSQGRPVRGRDRHLRGWDAWWWTLTRR